jgi:formate dehydrogenase (NADP+) beta subunit
MIDVVFSNWQNELIDNRGKSSEERVQTKLHLPAEYEAERKTKAFIGWSGVVIFDESIDVVRLAVEYAKTYQMYSEACGRCAPGRWGGRILYDTLDKIARGEGSKSDMAHLHEICDSMKLTSKCEIGRTVPNPILTLLEHFGDKFDDLIANQKKSPDYDKAEVDYNAKVTAPCMDVCPAHVDIPAYIEGVKDLRLTESLMATRGTMPLAHTCGRVCPHPCENACRRANLDEPISIMELKRIGADYESDRDMGWFHPMPKKESIGKKVAIVGSGPAGLAGAYYLCLDGVDCDVYEELPVLGGEVAVGVPEYRMPINKYNQDIEAVRAAGANFIVNTRVTADMMREFENKYDAVLIASGARISKKIRAKNERDDSHGYWPAIPFLDQINLFNKYGIGHDVDLTGKTVVCVGGGFTSMDVVRCSIRANAKRAIMLYRRDEKTIVNNTSYEEYHEAVEEGVEFIFYSALDEIFTDENNKITKLLVDLYELVPDPNGGRPQLLKAEGKSFELECDILVPAVSQDADLRFLPEEWEIAKTSWNTILTDGKTYATNRDKIFAAGDCEYGPMTIVNAVGQAKRAASVMSRYLRDGKIYRTDSEIMEDHLKHLKVYDKKEKVTGWLSGEKRENSEKLTVDMRKTNNIEVNLGFTAEQAIDEANRCMRCYYIAMAAV